MNIHEERVEGAVVVHLAGRLDTSTAPEVKTHLDTVVDEGADVVVVGLTDLDFMSSAGLRVLLATAKRLRPKGTLRLFGLNPTVRDVFDVSGFSMILPVFEDEPAAVAG
jgi:anti-sigma B factor antagonist